jgi:hypothetical protein
MGLKHRVGYGNMELLLVSVISVMAVIVVGLGLVIFDDFKYDGRWLDALVDKFSRRFGWSDIKLVFAFVVAVNAPAAWDVLAHNGEYRRAVSGMVGQIASEVR